MQNQFRIFIGNTEILWMFKLTVITKNKVHKHEHIAFYT